MDNEDPDRTGRNTRDDDFRSIVRSVVAGSGGGLSETAAAERITRIVRGAVQRLSTEVTAANDDFRSIVRGLVANSGGRSTEREASDFLNRVVRGAAQRLRAGEPETTVFATIRDLAPPQPARPLRHTRGNVGRLRQDEGPSRVGAPEMVVPAPVAALAPPQPARRRELRHMQGDVGAANPRPQPDGRDRSNTPEEQPQRRPGAPSRDSSSEPNEPRIRRGRTR